MSVRSRILRALSYDSRDLTKEPCVATIARACLRKLAVFVLLGIYLGLWSHSTVADPGAAAPDRLELLRLLRQSNFDELDVQLKQYRDDYQAGNISDHIVEQAYQSFASADPDLEPKLNEWIATRPDSHSARMARALFYQKLGLISRGYALSRKTPDERFAAMRDYLDLAGSDFSAALELNPRLSIAYGSLILIAMMRGDDAASDSLVRKGLEADSRSFVIRRRYLFSLVPWWRGVSSPSDGSNPYMSLLREWLGAEDRIEVPKSIQRFVAEIEQDAVDNPVLEPLKGFGDYVIADLLSRQDRREEAAEYFEKALRFGDYWWYLYRQGYNYFRLNRFDDAVASYTRALEAWPQVPDTLDWRARSLRKLNQLDRAFADWDLALSVDPRNPIILVQVAYALRQVKRYDDALSTLDRALLYGAHDDDVRDARGRILLYELNRPADAILDLERATQLDPGSNKYWYNYGLALYRTKDCKAVEALSTYRKVCEAGARCTKTNMAWAAEVIEYLRNPRICP